MATPLYGKTFAPGAVVDDYIVNELIAESGFSVLYRAEHRLTKDPVALKVMRASLLASEKMLVRFRREVDSLRQLDHSGIVKVVSDGELSDGRPYVATEWLPGRSLLQELSVRGPMTAREASLVLGAISSALEAAHQLGIIHRDLKAQNVVAVPDGHGWFRPVLLDFGIAKLREPRDGHGQLTTHTHLGTPHTTSPEQILGHEIDERADIYALGVLCFQLVTGRLPFDASTAIEVEEMHLHQPPPLPSDFAAVPVSIDRVVVRAMAKNPDERFSTVKEMVVALDSAASDTGTSETVDAVGFYVETAPKNDDGALVSADEMMAAAEQVARDHGLVISVDSSDALLAVGSGVDAEAVVESAQTLLEQFRQIDDVEVRIAVHRSPAEVVFGEIQSGEILSPSTWPSNAAVRA